jgi:integrase
VTFWYLQLVKNKMAKPLGLTTRGRSQQVRIVVPKDLIEAYGGRRDFRIALKSSGMEAKAEAHRLRAQKDAEFAERRRLLASATAEVTTVTADLGKAISSGVYAAGMAQDDALRENAEVQEALMELAALTASSRGLMIDTADAAAAAAPDFDGMPEEAAATLAGLNAIAEADAAIDLIRRRLSAVQPIADYVARRMGLRIDWSTDTAKAALKECLEQHRRSWRDRVLQDAGDLVPTPPQATQATAKQVMTAEVRHTLRDVLPLWKATRMPAANTYKKVTFAVALTEECLGPISLKEFTKAKGTELVGFLLTKCKAQKTAKDHFDSIKALLNFACDKQEWISENPWRAHHVTVKKRRQRKPWPVEALVTLFDSSLFKTYSLPTSVQAGGAAAYWVPIIGLYTGARQSELCQLRVEDVIKEADGYWMSILADAGDEDDDVPETSTKNEQTQRRVPVHSHLIDLGFEDFLTAAKEAGQALLFPDVKRAPGRPVGEYWGDWFGAYRKEQKVSRRYQDFHAFRHTSRSRLTDAGVDGMISSTLMGHTLGRNTGRDIYDHSRATLRPNLEKLRFDELGLRRCYPTSLDKS